MFSINYHWWSSSHWSWVWKQCFVTPICMARIFYFNLCIDIFSFFKITGETWTLMNLFQRQYLRVKWSLDELFYFLFWTYVLVKYPSLCSSRFWIKYIKCLNTVDICPCSFPEVLSLKNFSWICSPCVVIYFPVVEMHGRSFWLSVEELTLFISLFLCAYEV